MGNYLSSTLLGLPRSCGCSGHHHESDHHHGLAGYRLNPSNSSSASSSSSCSKNGFSNEAEITVFVAKQIVTMNPSWPFATCVAIQNGRILGVGNSLEHLRPWIGVVNSVKEVTETGNNILRYQHTRQGSCGKPINVVVEIDWSFADKIIFPGFIEPHMHGMIGGMALSLPCIAYWDFPHPYDDSKAHKGCKNRADAIAKLKEVLREKKQAGLLTKEDGVLAWGWDSIACGGHLSADDLDQVSTVYPVMVWDCSMHMGYVNRTCLNLNPNPNLKSNHNPKP